MATDTHGNRIDRLEQIVGILAEDQVKLQEQLGELATFTRRGFDFLAELGAETDRRMRETDVRMRETAERMFGNSNRRSARGAADDLEKYLALGGMVELAPAQLRELHFAIAFQRADENAMSRILAEEIRDDVFVQWILERTGRG